MADQRTPALTPAESVDLAKDRLIVMGREIDRGVGHRVAASKWLWLGGAFVVGLAISPRVGVRRRAPRGRMPRRCRRWC